MSPVWQGLAGAVPEFGESLSRFGAAEDVPDSEAIPVELPATAST